MAIRADHNLYPGINPHLNSALQQRGGGWRGFHSRHITHISEALDRILPFGYFTADETSIQIGAYDPDTDQPAAPPSLNVPDITVYHGFQHESGGDTLSSSTSAPTMTLPVIETLLEEHNIPGIMIYRLTDNAPGRQAVTRIELLSPSNKYPNSYYYPYLAKRGETLLSGLCLVEIDYIHEYRPILEAIPSYANFENSAYPYHILVSNPHPTLDQGVTKIYGFGVLDHMPTFEIPLLGSERISLDLGAVYNHTFRSFRLYTQGTDYAQTPANFAAYTSADQQRIAAFMASIASEQTSYE